MMVYFHDNTKSNLSSGTRRKYTGGHNTKKIFLTHQIHAFINLNSLSGSENNIPGHNPQQQPRCSLHVRGRTRGRGRQDHGRGRRGRAEGVVMHPAAAIDSVLFQGQTEYASSHYLQGGQPGGRDYILNVSERGRWLINAFLPSQNALSVCDENTNNCARINLYTSRSGSCQTGNP